MPRSLERKFCLSNLAFDLFRNAGRLCGGWLGVGWAGEQVGWAGRGWADKF